MKLQLLHEAIEQTTADTLIINLFDDVTTPSGATGAVDAALGGAISELIASGDLKGKAGEVGVLYPRGAIPAQRVLVVGLGSRAKFDVEQVRRASATGVKRAADLGGRQVATIVHGAGVAGLDVATAAQATVEGAAAVLYQYRANALDDLEARLATHGAWAHEHTPAEGELVLSVVEVAAEKLAAVEAGLRVGTAVAQGAGLARDLVNLPPNIATPAALAEVARYLAERHGFRATIGDRAWAAEQKMGAFLAVAQGSADEPYFIALEHDGAEEAAVVLVGKGVTFDTGGISIKPTENMWQMKSDMAGAAAVLGTMHTVGALKLARHVVGLAPCTDNKPDSAAYRPADVITASNGKTIEIISTDAEGRMILADALVFAQRYTPAAVIDLATLTGACVIALGEDVAAGIFCNDEALQGRLTAAGQATFERLWPMPLWDDYREKIKTDVADMKNSGGRYGGVGTSAVFLREFTAYPWAHLDIAGMAYSSQAQLGGAKGATGFGVRLLIAYLRN